MNQSAVNITNAFAQNGETFPRFEQIASFIEPIREKRPTSINQNDPHILLAGSMMASDIGKQG